MTLSHCLTLKKISAMNAQSSERLPTSYYSIESLKAWLVYVLRILKLRQHAYG